MDPQFNRVTGTLGVTSRTSTGSVAVGAGSVWVAFGDSTLARILPLALSPAGSVLAGAIPSALVVVGGDVWVANSADATVQRFAAATFEEGPIRTISVGGQPAAIAYGEDALWVANRADDTVTRIDPRTYATRDIHVGDRPVAVATGEGAVWVANAGDRIVPRINPAANEVVRTLRVETHRPGSWSRTGSSGSPPSARSYS